MTKTKYYIGTAGWKYDDWIGSFYPKKENAAFNWLQYYAQYFNCVEVNSTYYAYMSERVVNSWIRKTGKLDDFKFTIKLHQDFTHKRCYNKENINAFYFILDMLQKAERLGGLLIQFPQSFKFDESSAAYISRLRELFSGYKIFIEIRHGSFHSNEAIDFFKSASLNCITIDQPQIGCAISFKPLVINKSLYIRLHGRNKEAWFKGFDRIGKEQTAEERSARYDYLYLPGELIEITQQIKSAAENVEEVFVITNNHLHGNAIANALQLINILEERKINIPPITLMAYPHLEELHI